MLRKFVLRTRTLLQALWPLQESLHQTHPILTLANTGYGIPCLTLGLPDRFTNHMIKKPASIKAKNTAQPFNPEAKNNDAAKVYPNKL